MTQAPTFQLAMTDGEAEAFRSHLSRSKRYLEFGSGGSTIAALDGPAEWIVSVETDPAWLAALRGNPAVAAAEASGRITLHHANIGETFDWGMPKDASRMVDWPAYYLGIWNRVLGTPDLVLIDGRFRVATAISALLAVPPGTPILMHDFGAPEVWRRNYRRLQDVAKVEPLSGQLVRLGHSSQTNAAALLALLSDVWADFA